ncbi:sulfurase [Luteibacter rhizovicinus DSM 16549]|uniref:Sulfurase n=1 Tax=Luteibacter rhizovicinus DSM 16549 TaxID=1440763 RepID=A0A0G9HAV7_9GAMM|nr:MOSC and FAD-binding oxidoreductase domain-containing protein [Luteibacter rhizovicinus]APG06628.1 sulfurase [Luteibacter rhizovicinus DSM 16549]KLD66945.1 sulfurase [Luteibacter rhizovicinus DSM 16549]
MATLISVNVGLPKDVAWQGQVVYTSVWKAPVTGRVMARRLNIDGDGQGDLKGHGGEHRAVMVYQTESYRYWEAFLARPPLEPGSFGENLTVDGLPDSEVCIGDRFRIGDALLEVTQPRVTCYRVGLRMEEPRMPSLLVSHKRPGFYCRVIEEGLIGAGDVITRELSGSDVSVTEIDALLYLTDHPRDALQRAIDVPALSTGWRQSLEAMLSAGPEASGNAGLSTAPAAEPAWPGFREVRVCSTHEESASVRSFVVEAADGAALPPARGGQFIVVRLTPPPPHPPLIRSYSLSDASTHGRYRFSVKRAAGEGSAYLHTHVGQGDRLSISAPRGSFFLGPDTGPVVLWSAGIGITPVLAMLRELASTPSAPPRKIYWVHGARSGEENAFAAEVDGLLRQMSLAVRLIAFSQPLGADSLGRDYDVQGRITVATLGQLAIPADARVYLCGPTTFMEQARASLHSAGFADANILSERFGGEEALRPGIVGAVTRAPHPPTAAATEGALVTFVRSGLTVHWDTRYASLLELAEACDVPVRWSCRSGVCHNCETPMIDGAVSYVTDPLQPAANGRILICCTTPAHDVELDL